MTAVVNGAEWPLAEGMTVARLLSAMGLPPGMTVVELNGRVLRRPEFEACALGDGDRVEVVRFVGGG